MRHVIANDIPYSSVQTNPLKALSDLLAFSSRDWGEERDTAWLYGIVCGWDGDEGDESAMPEVAAKFGWADDRIARLRALHRNFEALAES